MELLKELTEAFGPPGFEEEVRTIVLRELKGLVDDASIDKLGSVIAVKKTKNRAKKPLKIMLAGHMDEIGFVVKHIDKNGFLRLSPLGGFDPKTLLAKRVVLQGKKGKQVGVIGCKPIHLLTKEDKAKLPELRDLFLDIGLSHAEAKKSVEMGAPAALFQPFLQFGNLVSGKALDNRIAVWTLLKTLQRLKGKKIDADVYAVFTTQEEVGMRGAVTAAYHVEPDVGVAVDITMACDIPNISDFEHVTRLGEGTAIKICDSTSISNPRLVRFLRDLARRRKIRHQMEILPQGGTDAGGIQKARGGVPVVTLSVPTRYAHTVVEAAHTGDLNATISLLTAFLQEAHRGNFSYN